MATTHDSTTTSCEFTHEVSDDEFGYWDPAWGDPAVHSFGCGDPATTRFTVRDEYDEGYHGFTGTPYEPATFAYCDTHARQFREELATGLLLGLEILADEPVSSVPASTV